MNFEVIATEPFGHVADLKAQLVHRPRHTNALFVNVLPLHKAFVMYRQVFTPDNSKLILQLPKEFVGRLVEVLAFTVDEAQANDGQHSWDNAKKFFNTRRISLKGFRFDRDEANER